MKSTIYIFIIKGQSLTAKVHKEGRNYVAKCIEVPVADFGTTKSKALANIKETTKEHLLAFPEDISKIKKEKEVITSF